MSLTKRVFFDLDDNKFKRYLYLLIKSFELAGYQVYIKPNLNFISKLSNKYSRLLYAEGSVIFSNKAPTGSLMITDRKSKVGSILLSADYFSSFDEQAKNINSFHIPMAMHPMIYHKGLWNKEYIMNKNGSVFFAGNFDTQAYSNFSKENVFRMLGRIEILAILKNNNNVVFPKSFEQLKKSNFKRKIVVVDIQNFLVPIENLRETISEYSFFIACPGVVMPMSHNVIEAMSVGAIPILHERYAKLFTPELVDYENAIIYNNENFGEKLEECLTMNSSNVDAIVKNVLQYYKGYLHPVAVISNLFSGGEKNIIYLNAEQISVRMLESKIGKHQSVIS
ncbi:hypothetical protein [Paracnuella aquatica]|uniref:hypothetical protein n=1 Tax=Paracnuella aquatica TaxID=2268757 RepID=UPI000DEF6E80|nr:hypothetical protein [Paracnuella aquatica]RPD45527.1 hypothetical protein DRJ53_15080 [Paracnuella aquatica]